ncbi:hypothetical protein CRE_09499 [Caenorhabditis remanei]|uniref:Serpentine Receptor, class H n=1 Tax=Caenorhabditis remanei TaxID=31234 RepID=E3MIW1_CAERE|nr:hypothetical protein CRE_09499 [Caenorhabditis remanei]
MGFAADLGTSAIVQVIIGLAMTFVILISVMILFENRSSLIARNRFGISKTSTRIAWVSVNFFGSLLLLVPIFLNLPDQMKVKLDILKALPCPAKEFFTEPTFVLAGEDFGKTYMIATVMFIYFNFLAQIVFFFVCCVYYLFIFKSSQVSIATRRLQIQSFFGMLGQTLIPVLFDSIPMIVQLARHSQAEYDQFNNNLMGLSIILHNGATSLSILLIHSSYRNFLKSLVGGEGGKKVNVINVSVERRI